MRVAGVVVLYNPDFKKLILNICSIISEVEMLFLIDNSDSICIKVDDLCKLSNNIRYIRNNENCGIAKALNQGAIEAIKEGFEWLLTMDQDSYFSDNLFFKTFLSFQDKTNVVIFSPSFRIESQQLSQDNKYVDTDYVITSGNIINLSIWNKLGGFRVDLFIDEVDTEFCFKARKNGFRIVFFEHIYMVHQLGVSYKVNSIFTGKEFLRYEHPPQRYYYMTRNRLIIIREYIFIYPSKCLVKLLHFPRMIYGIIAYETQRKQKIFYILKGVFHFFIGKKGALLM